ncbi:pentatricopeptide repeat-containing protein At5g02830, chloroplastic [Aristolochia californica]|uniref:pentatricopeptide repeat-containing protein At5g02830, chloroplastic n=1 Tax=Aristolochia californica TaxID=171875 RepID=UPI0035DBAB73
MILESVSDSASTHPSQFVAAMDFSLVSAGITELLRRGKLQSVLEVLGELKKLGVPPSSLFDGPTLDMFKVVCRSVVEEGRLKDFVEVMEVLSGYGIFVKDFIEPHDVIKMCVQKRDPNMAVRYASLLPHPHILFISIIHQFGKKRDLMSALIAFDASKLKFESPNMYACRTIIDVCGLCGDYLRSRYIFEGMLAQSIVPNVYVFNSLMNVNARDLSYTMHIYKQMQILNVPADLATYNILLKIYCLAGSVERAQDIYEEVRHMASVGACRLDVITYSTIIKVFADAKMWQLAWKIKEDMVSDGVSPNVVTWSSLISAFAKADLVERAIHTFDEMLLSGYEPNAQCSNVVLNACVKSCQYDRAFRFFHLWMKNGLRMGNTNNNIDSGDNSGENGVLKVVPFRPTVATYNILMKACGTDYIRAKALMDQMREAGLSPNQISWSILIDIYGRSNNIKGAMQAFRTMHDSGIKPDVVAYTTTIKACVQNKDLKMAFSLFGKMKKYRIRPNLVTYNTLLSARSRYGSLHEVQQCLSIYLDMRKSGYRSNDYFLKELLEEWCEGVIKNNDRCRGLEESSNETLREPPPSVLLEKVALHLQKDISECLTIGLSGLSKVEARIVVLAVLRMVKESYIQGYPIEDDLVITFGVEKEELAPINQSNVRGAIIKVLQDELGLEVHSRPQNVRRNGNIDDKIPARKVLHGESEYLARRPLDNGRLWVKSQSLLDWLNKRRH